MPLLAVLLGLTVGAGLSAPVAAAASNATPDYEVKLNLTTAALDSSGGLSPQVRGAFGLGSTPQSVSYAYFDDDAQSLKASGWSVRLRHKAGKDLDLNYKKRYAITGGDIDGALAAAKKDGFDSSENDYEAQVDWTYDKQTLSFANKKKSSAGGLSGTALPGEADGKSLLVDKTPGKLAKAGGEKTLENSRQHGPVTGRTWSGSWKGVDVEVEVLPVRAASGSGTETVIEFSFKADTLAQASALRTAALAELGAGGWLKTAGVLKTDLILQRY